MSHVLTKYLIERNNVISTQWKQSLTSPDNGSLLKLACSKLMSDLRYEVGIIYLFIDLLARTKCIFAGKLEEYVRNHDLNL